MASELKGALLSLVAIAATFYFPRARVLTLPFFFIFVLILIFWSARRSAEREDER